VARLALIGLETARGGYTRIWEVEVKLPDPISTLLIRLLVHLMGDRNRGASVDAPEASPAFPCRQHSGAAIDRARRAAFYLTGAVAHPTRFVDRDVAVEAGTANTLAYVRGCGVVLCEPSVMALDSRTGSVRAGGARRAACSGAEMDLDRRATNQAPAIIQFGPAAQMLRHFIQGLPRRRSTATLLLTHAFCERTALAESFAP
jgi:hypothetical protein